MHKVRRKNGLRGGFFLEKSETGTFHNKFWLWKFILLQSNIKRIFITLKLIGVLLLYLYLLHLCPFYCSIGVLKQKMWVFNINMWYYSFKPIKPTLLSKTVNRSSQSILMHYMSWPLIGCCQWMVVQPGSQQTTNYNS